MTPSSVLAALYRHDVAAAEALAAGVDLTLWEAAALGRVEVLIRRNSPGTDLSQPGPDGFTPLHLACYFGRAEAASWLLQHGADVHAAGPGDLRPLHSAVAGPDGTAAVAISQTLLTQGAHPDAVQRGGYTALHAAARRGLSDLVQALVRHGADPSRRTEAGQRAEDLAVEAGHSTVAAWLRAQA
jgi:ankyrin repeat protein